MKAIVCDRYGPPDVLRLEEVERPTPRDNQVLVKVHASSLNAADFEILGGAVSARIFSPFRPRNRIPGSDVAGRVVAVGKNIKRLKIGEAVFGDLFACGFGAFAEYVAVPEDALVWKPDSISFEDAATFPQAAKIALQGLRGKRPLKKGQKVLINGAGGGMGTFAVQIAKYYGAEVTGVDNAGKLDMLRAIGADHVIDYAKEDCTRGGERYDLILDTVARRSIFNYRRIMAPDGLFVLVGGSRYAIFQSILLGPLVSIASKKKMGINPMNVNNEEDLRFLLELLENEKLIPVIDRRIPLSEVPGALSDLSKGLVKGKVVITVEHDDNI
ncbi:MAG TPA: NAD(P)-dependent alcohol dehydrogenase [Methanomassiliicoccales archaeon]|jgi:NADPH:quinone reductase-like Zn-dependent oxidoreductase